MLTDRILGVFKLQPAVFEEIEHDRGATGQAALIVAIVALLSALGSMFSAAITHNSLFLAFLSALLWTFFGWFIWSAISYVVGTTFFGGKADLGEMLRVIGFAYAPQMLSIIPCVGALIGAIWSLLAGFIAMRQGLDLDDLRTLFTLLAGFLVYFLGGLFINLALGVLQGLLG